MDKCKVVGKNILRIMINRADLEDHLWGKAVHAMFRIGNVRWSVEIYLDDDITSNPLICLLRKLLKR